MSVGHADSARTALGLIRLGNGLLALFAPRLLLGRLAREGQTSGPAVYVLRMFGVRTILLGLDLLIGDDAQVDAALRRAPAIHATDATAAITAVMAGDLRLRAAAPAIAISGVNLALALRARNTARTSP